MALRWVCFSIGGPGPLPNISSVFLRCFPIHGYSKRKLTNFRTGKSWNLSSITADAGSGGAVKYQWTLGHAGLANSTLLHAIAVWTRPPVWSLSYGFCLIVTHEGGYIIHLWSPGCESVEERAETAYSIWYNDIIAVSIHLVGDLPCYKITSAWT